MGKYKIRPARFIPALIITFCITGLLLWALWVSVAWAKSAVLQRMLDIRFMARDEITETAPASGLLIRTEESFKASAPGEVELKVRDGERLRVGTPLAEIKGVSQSTVWSPRAGIFCTHVDGLENLLLPEMIGELDLMAVENIKPLAPPADNTVDSGQYFGKVVDNLQPLFMHVQWENQGSEAARSFRTGETVHFVYKGQELAGQVKDVRSAGSDVYLVVEMRDYPDEFVHLRNLHMELVIRRLSGWLVPREAVVFKDGEPGIYVALRQRVNWVPVSVNDRLDDTVSITGSNLNDALRYISNPERVREGARLGTGG
ncbi:MAG: hypothetical protein JL56_01975 [Desulfotomaculum sp. BICA1-6]|nr:MAG: hypothetical protein VR67_13525 [Peptococcaceae bacterium BRH_c8a]KJS77996.1 MAG: hypothetical protein JL56_01975 [Desulfotomaculum sp. BICA1-6]